jgi:predicted lipid carrier protein YhbT
VVVIVDFMDTTFQVEVVVDGPTVNDWYETDVRVEGDLSDLLQRWSRNHYEILMDQVQRQLVWEGEISERG